MKPSDTPKVAPASVAELMRLVGAYVDSICRAHWRDVQDSREAVEAYATRFAAPSGWSPKDMHDTLQRIGSALGITAGSDLKTALLPELHRLLAAPAASAELQRWHLIDPTGAIAATECSCIIAWARIDGYKPTVEGLLGYEQAGWRVAPAASAEPAAWLYTCKKAPSGGMMTYASVDENDKNHWPTDQWRSIVKEPLVRLSDAAAVSAEPVGRDALYDLLEDVLLLHKTSTWVNDDGEGLPLVDLLTRQGDKSIESGHHEIRLICDDFYNKLPHTAAGEQELPARLLMRLREADIDYTIEWGSGDLYGEAADEIERLSALASRRLPAGWVSVDERLPEKNIEVLIAFRDTSLAATGQYTASQHDTWGWCFPRENDPEDTGPITHWQPLPATPAQAGEGAA